VRYSTVLFDLDGTLVDSGQVMDECLRELTLELLGREPTAVEFARFHVGGRLVECMRAIDEERAEELVDAYRERYHRLAAGHSCFDGIERLLRELKTEGRRLGLVTAKRRQATDIVLRAAGLEDTFDAIVTSEETERHKPEPEPLLLALERLGATPETAAYVCDGPHDVAAARAAGVAAVAVSWGGIHEREALEEARPALLTESVEELRGAL
jgi:pyrophosphatase PpaX